MATNEKVFKDVPSPLVRSSRFTGLSHRHLTTFNAGYAVPIYCQECLPGDTFNIKVSSLIRGSTPLRPVMDDAYLTVNAFFVPHRLVWDNWEKFMGDDEPSAWTSPTVHTVPQVVAPAIGGWSQGSVADHFEVPTKVIGPGTYGLKINALQFRSYCKLWSDWYRDENLQQKPYFPTGDAQTTGQDTSASGDPLLNAYAGGNLLPVNKRKDYFTTATPKPQKGDAVDLPLGQFPVYFDGTDNMHDTVPMEVVDVQSGTRTRWNPGDFALGSAQNPLTTGFTATVSSYGRETLDNTGDVRGAAISNGFADGSLGGLTVEDLRKALAIQTILEKRARTGSRYAEILRASFGVISPDARLDRSEYLGGFEQRIELHQVLQNGASSSTSPLGATGAYSLTVNSKDVVHYSCQEHGFIIFIADVRTAQTYQQGLSRQWTRHDRLDYYTPELAYLGEMPVKNKEIYCNADQYDDQTFGFQEAWAEYRFAPNSVTGMFRSNYAAGTLDSWHYAQKYTSRPSLSASWIKEDKSVIDRTLAVSSSVADQFLADFHFQVTADRPLPVYSVPKIGGF